MIKYYYAGKCNDTLNGNRIQELVGQDEWEYSEEDEYHPPEYRMSKEYFLELTGWSLLNKKGQPREADFYGMNMEYDVVFCYIDGLHYFFTTTGAIDLE